MKRGFDEGPSGGTSSPPEPSRSGSVAGSRPQGIGEPTSGMKTFEPMEMPLPAGVTQGSLTDTGHKSQSRPTLESDGSREQWRPFVAGVQG